MKSYYDREDSILAKVYPIEKMYTPNGPNFDNEFIKFYLLMDEEGKGINWQLFIDKQLMIIPFKKNKEIDYNKLRGIKNLIISDKIWTCNCKSGKFIHPNDLALCMECSTVWQGVWYQVNEKGRNKCYKSKNLFPTLSEYYGYEPQDFEMTDEQLISLTFVNFEMLEPTYTEPAYC